MSSKRLGASSPPPFQALTMRYDGLADRIITGVQVFPAFDPEHPPDPPPIGVNAHALWDTGASKSVISENLASRIGLTPVGKTKVNHAAGISTHPTHLVNFRLPNGVAIIGVLVTESPVLSGFDVLIGMDIIRFGDFSITNVDGRTCMSFRTPSMQAVDFVQEHNRLAFHGVGRNDACPCQAKRPDGGPVKFKNCHGKT